MKANKDPVVLSQTFGTFKPMPKILSEKQIAEYEENGLVFPVTVMSENDAKLLTRKLETYEAESGGPIQKEWRHKVHLLFTWANES